MKKILLSLSLLAFAIPAYATESTLNVKVATPEIGSVARGAQRVPVLNITLTVPCSSAPVTVSSMTISRKGLGAPSDIARTYLLSGFARLSRSYPLQSKGEPLSLPFRSLKIAPCESRNLVLAVDFSIQAQVASEHVFSITNLDTHGATVKINAETTGGLQVGASGTPAIVTAELLPILTPVSYGGNRTIARLSLQGTAGKDQRITAITLTNNGSASDGDLQRLYWATRTGEVISEVIPQLRGRTARITLDPGLLLEGRDTKLIELHADVRASRKRTLRFELEESSDIEAAEVRLR